MSTVREQPLKANRGPAAGPQNRRALIAAAREVYASRGVNAPFSAVARRAGVGQGSLYRHFPDRTALAVAVLEDNLQSIEAAVAAPDRTLDDLLDSVADHALGSTAFLQLLSMRDPRVVLLRRRFRVIIDAVVTREREAGRLAPGIETADVALVTGMLSSAVANAEPEDRADAARRARAMFRAALLRH